MWDFAAAKPLAAICLVELHGLAGTTGMPCSSTCSTLAGLISFLFLILQAWFACLTTENAKSDIVIAEQ